MIFKLKIKLGKGFTYFFSDEEVKQSNSFNISDYYIGEEKRKKDERSREFKFSEPNFYGNDDRYIYAVHNKKNRKKYYIRITNFHKDNYIFPHLNDSLWIDTNCIRQFNVDQSTIDIFKNLITVVFYCYPRAKRALFNYSRSLDNEFLSSNFPESKNPGFSKNPYCLERKVDNCITVFTSMTEIRKILTRYNYSFSLVKYEGKNIPLDLVYENPLFRLCMQGESYYYNSVLRKKDKNFRVSIDEGHSNFSDSYIPLMQKKSNLVSENPIYLYKHLLYLYQNNIYGKNLNEIELTQGSYLIVLYCRFSFIYVGGLQFDIDKQGNIETKFLYTISGIKQNTIYKGVYSNGGRLLLNILSTINSDKRHYLESYKNAESFYEHLGYKRLPGREDDYTKYEDSGNGYNYFYPGFMKLTDKTHADLVTFQRKWKLSEQKKITFEDCPKCEKKRYFWNNRCQVCKKSKIVVEEGPQTVKTKNLKRVSRTQPSVDDIIQCPTCKTKIINSECRKCGYLFEQ